MVLWLQEVLFGNPFIFEKIKTYLETGKEARKITNRELLEVMIRHISLEVEEKGEYTGIREMRKHLAYYTKGLNHSHVIREKINQIGTKEELIRELNTYFHENVNI